MKAFLALSLLVLTVACGKQEDAPQTALGYACNQVTSGGPTVTYACFQAVTGEVCSVVADAETGARLSSDCSEYN